MKIGFIGFGRMGSALALGALSAQALTKNQIVVCDPSQSGRAKKLGLRVERNPQSILVECDIVFLCVKPQKMDRLLADLTRNHPGPRPYKICLVSIAAGVSLARISKRVGRGFSLVRVMPNTPALLKAGMSVVAWGPDVALKHKKQIALILRSVGTVAFAKEKFMDAVTALSGSGPAYVFYLAEALIASARRAGFSETMARQLVHETIYGAGCMLKLKSETATELREQVTSPGGTTATAIAEFEKKKTRGIIMGAIKKATQRAKELGQG